MDDWYVLFRDGGDAKWAAAADRTQAIAAAGRLLRGGAEVIELGPLDPGAADDTVIGDALRDLCGIA